MRATHWLHFPCAAHVDTDRFTWCIARELLALDPALVLRVGPEDSPIVGDWSVGGATATGLLDDFFVVESRVTGRFKVIDFQDAPSITEGLSWSPKFAGAAVMMFHPPTVWARYGPRAAHLIHPGWFVDQRPAFTRSHRAEVARIRDEADLDPRLFFRGTIHGETPGKEYCRNGRNIREVALVLRERYPDEVDISGYKLEREDWFRAAARHRWVLTLPGHPWCYREFEMMSLGIPTITLRWTSYLYHQPVHYVAVDGLEQDPIGFALDPVAAADAIMCTFRAVRDDTMRMRSIGAQAQAWYDRFCSPAAIAYDMRTFLDLPHL